jgi:hypothetical protein
VLYRDRSVAQPSSLQPCPPPGQAVKAQDPPLPGCLLPRTAPCFPSSRKSACPLATCVPPAKNICVGSSCGSQQGPILLSATPGSHPAQGAPGRGGGCPGVGRRRCLPSWHSWQAARPGTGHQAGLLESELSLDSCSSSSSQELSVWFIGKETSLREVRGLNQGTQPGSFNP